MTCKYSLSSPWQVSGRPYPDSPIEFIIFFSYAFFQWHGLQLILLHYFSWLVYCKYGIPWFLNTCQSSYVRTHTHLPGRCFGRSRLLILLAIKSRNTPKLTTRIGKYLQNYLSAQKTTDMIIVKCLRLKLYKKTIKNNSHEKMQYLL
jgi:hypothetical protein